MKIYYACPVRNIDTAFINGLWADVERLESEGNHVYFPHRDTPQGAAEPDICEQNRAAIAFADIVYIAWDGKSEGVLFDMGIAWAMEKPIRVAVGRMPQMSRGKSFQNFFYWWEER